MMGKCELCGETHRPTLEVNQYIFAPNTGESVPIPHTICVDCNEEIIAETAPGDVFDLAPESF
jgi:ribosomal protein L32